MLKGFVHPIRPGSMDYLRDIGWICRELRASEWGVRLTDAKIKKAMMRSTSFGIYVGGEPDLAIAGFARVVTDDALFSTITDFIITKEARGHGLGRQLLEHILAHASVKHTECVLHTGAARDFYAKFGFKVHTEGVMLRPMP